MYWAKQVVAVTHSYFSDVLTNSLLLLIGLMEWGPSGYLAHLSYHMSLLALRCQLNNQKKKIYPYICWLDRSDKGSAMKLWCLPIAFKIKISQEVTVRWLSLSICGKTLRSSGMSFTISAGEPPAMIRLYDVSANEGWKGKIFDRHVEWDLSREQSWSSPFLLKEGKSTVTMWKPVPEPGPWLGSFSKHHFSPIFQVLLEVTVLC